MAALRHLLLCLLCLACGGQAGAQVAAHATGAPPLPSDTSVKAAYLFRFIPYVDWPPAALSAPEAPLVIGVFKSDEMLVELAGIIVGRSVNGHPVLARKVSDSDALDDLHVLFVGRARLPAAMKERLHERPLLLVTEGRDAGGALSFLMVDGRVRFEAAPKVAERAGLKLSSRLLAIAERIAP